MNTILVPTDFSETANNALEVAAQLSQKYDCRLIVLHMLEIPIHILPGVTLSADVHLVQTDHQSELPQALFYMKLAQKRFAETAEQPFLKGVNYEVAIQNHLDFKGIIDTAHKYNSDLIVMGSHGTSALKDVFIGSNTDKVVRTSDIPVLVIKRKNENFKVSNFVFATNWENNSEKSITDAYKLATILGAKLTILHVNTPSNTFLTSQEIKEKFDDFFLHSTIKVNDVNTIEYSDTSIEEGILNYSEAVKADLIGVSTHGRRGLSHFINESITEDIANHSEIPVVTFKLDSSH